MKSGKMQPQDVPLFVVYTISKALAISPLEVYKMPNNLVQDLLIMIQIQSEIENEQIEKATKGK